MNEKLLKLRCFVQQLNVIYNVIETLCQTLNHINNEAVNYHLSLHVFLHHNLYETQERLFINKLNFILYIESNDFDMKHTIRRNDETRQTSSL